ncbi:MAG TPA: asparagine synthetase B family protein [Acidimicrobiia bacterium]|nr:asparagine synthetase B family protein [Acidimicrobiia bacterium]
MNSVVGYLSQRDIEVQSIGRALGAGSQIGRLGRAGIAVRGPAASLATSDDWLCGLSGRVDNHNELISRVGPEDSEGTSSAGLVGRLLAREGIEALGGLRGVFAGVFTDGHRLWSFRDHMGFWPMFHTSVDGQSVAADSIRACVDATGQGYVVDDQNLEDFFYGRIGTSTATAIKGVERIRAGTWVQDDAVGSRIEQYWRPKELVEVDPPREDEIPELFDSLMGQAVDRVVTGSDAVSLSGGIDSPVLAAYAAPLYRSRFGRALPALSAIYPDLPSVDEEQLIRLVAGDLGMPLHTFRPNASATDDLRRWVAQLDGPVPVVSLAETLETLSVAKSQGITNLITGEWAEYLFDMPQRTLAYLIRRGRWRAARRYWGSLRDQDVPVGTIASRLMKDLAPFGLRRGMALRRMGATTPEWIDRSQLVFQPRGPVVRDWMSSQAAMGEGPALGLEADHVVQMAAGVSIRRPFADVDLVEFFLRLPAEVKYPGPGRKQLIRALARGKVPDAILDRRDKTLFDEAVKASIDYGQLVSLLGDDSPMPGVDYGLLRSRLHSRELDLVEYMWAKDLAAVHAFRSFASST